MNAVLSDKLLIIKWNFCGSFTKTSSRTDVVLSKEPFLWFRDNLSGAAEAYDDRRFIATCDVS